jgi:hypothetical protein
MDTNSGASNFPQDIHDLPAAKPPSIMKWIDSSPVDEKTIQMRTSIEKEFAEYFHNGIKHFYNSELIGVSSEGFTFKYISTPYNIVAVVHLNVKLAEENNKLPSIDFAVSKSDDVPGAVLPMKSRLAGLQLYLLGDKYYVSIYSPITYLHSRKTFYNSISYSFLKKLMSLLIIVCSHYYAFC